MKNLADYIFEASNQKKPLITKKRILGVLLALIFLAFFSFLMIEKLGLLFFLKAIGFSVAFTFIAVLIIILIVLG